MRVFYIILLLVLWVPGNGQSADSNQAHIEKAEDWMRSLDTAKASFIQKSSNGSRLTGTFYLDRPGKLRFDYNEVDDFIVADGFLIYFYDAELGEQTNAPIGSTLADFFLRKDLKFSGDLTVIDFKRKSGHTMITLAQTDDPGAGSVELIFAEKPYHLRKWRIVDPAGITTDIELQNLERDIDLSYRLFGYLKPKDPADQYKGNE